MQAFAEKVFVFPFSLNLRLAVKRGLGIPCTHMIRLLDVVEETSGVKSSRVSGKWFILSWILFYSSLDDLVSTASARSALARPLQPSIRVGDDRRHTRPHHRRAAAPTP